MNHVAAASALLALPLLMIACSDGSKPTGSGAGATSATATAAAASASATAGPKPVTCALDEAQYVDWDDWGKACHFAVPKAPAALPPRISWEACGPAVGLSGCKKLKVRAGAALTSVRAGSKRPDVVEIAYVEECKTETQKYAQLVISEADGPTLAAFASKAHEPGKCDIDIADLHQGGYIARLTGEAGSAVPAAFVGAPTQTSKPAVLFSWDTGSAPRGAVVSDMRWVVFGPAGAKTARWGDPQPETVTENSLNVEPSLHHDEIFWADGDISVVKAAAKVEKLRGTELGDAAHALGTDGHHLVFTHRSSGDDAKPQLVAGPYTTEPDKLSLDAVLPLPKTMDVASPWTVGCGYAAHAAGTNEVLIVRLKDGVSWSAASKGCDSNGLCLEKALAVTCSDVFFSATSKSGQDRTIVRVTFAGLGKGKDPAAPPAKLGAPAASASGSPSAAPSTSASAAPKP